MIYAIHMLTYIYINILYKDYAHICGIQYGKIFHLCIRYHLADLERIDGSHAFRSYTWSNAFQLGLLGNEPWTKDDWKSGD